MTVFSRKPDELPLDRLRRQMAAAPDEEARDLLAQNFGRTVVREVSTGPYNEHDYQWGATPPESDLCTDCYEWRRYPPVQAHFGWAWWRTCDERCDHPHHRDEIWIA